MLVELYSHPTFPNLMSSGPDVRWFNWGMGDIQGKSNGKLFNASLNQFLDSLPEPLRNINYDPSFSRYLVPPNLHYGISPWYKSMLFMLTSNTGIYEKETGEQVQMAKGRYYLIDLSVRFRFYDAAPVEYLGVKFKTPFSDVYKICTLLGYFNKQ